MRLRARYHPVARARRVKTATAASMAGPAKAEVGRPGAGETRAMRRSGPSGATAAMERSGSEMVELGSGLRETGSGGAPGAAIHGFWADWK